MYSTQNFHLYLTVIIMKLDFNIEDLADDEGFIDQDGDEVFVQEVAM